MLFDVYCCYFQLFVGSLLAVVVDGVGAVVAVAAGVVLVRKTLVIQ